MKDSLSVRVRAGRILIGIGLAAAATSAAWSQSMASPGDGDVLELDNYIVVATRSAQSIDLIPSAAVVFTPGDWKATQQETLAGVLGGVTGTTVAQSGAVGAGAAVFMRGSEAYETLLLVDGVRINDRSEIYQPFLGGASLSNVGRIEVVRGPQSPLYGGSAMGGIVSYETARGAGAGHGRVSGEAGSFGTWRTGAEIAGEADGLSFSAGAERLETANDRPDNSFEQTSASTRIEWTATPALTIGGTFRLQDSTYEEPDVVGPYPYPGVVGLTQNLGTVYARYAAGERFVSKLTLATQLRDYVFDTSYGPGTPSHFTRKVLDWQNEWKATDGLQFVGGVNAEQSELAFGGAANDERLRAAYLSGIWESDTGTVVTGGLRRDDYDTAGAATPWRLGVAQRLAATGMKLRATYGTAFTAPSLDDRYGSLYQPANAGIRPERSRGWDAGVDQSWRGGALKASATYFANKYTGKFGYDYATFQTINIAAAKSDGVELELRGNWRGWTARIGQTWTDTEDESTGKPLVRRPRSVTSVDVEGPVAKGVRLGAGLMAAADREDVDPTTYQPVQAPDYVVARIFGSWEPRPGLRLTARVENVLDREYQAVLGYPSLPVGAYGGVEWAF